MSPRAGQPGAANLTLDDAIEIYRTAHRDANRRGVLNGAIGTVVSSISGIIKDLRKERLISGRRPSKPSNPSDKPCVLVPPWSSLGSAPRAAAGAAQVAPDINRTENTVPPVGRSALVTTPPCASTIPATIAS